MPSYDEWELTNQYTRPTSRKGPHTMSQPDPDAPIGGDRLINVSAVIAVIIAIAFGLQAIAK